MATNDEIRLKMTVSKMNIHRSTRLETIAARSILRNLDAFLDPQYSETRHVMLLPIALRNIVLEQWLMRQFAELQNTQKWSKTECDKILEKRMKVFNSLVSCHTLEADLTPFFKDRYNVLAREHVLEYLKLIGAKATNLKVLILLETVGQLNIRPLCDAIGKFHNLKSLDIRSILINYTNLKELCKNLESLTHLSSSLIFDPSFDVTNEREIEELQIFSNLIVFETDGQNEKFTLKCIQHLPKLQCAGYLGFPHLRTPTIEELLDRCPNQKFALTRMTLSAQCNKEIHLNFPHVTNLEVRCHLNDNFIPNSLPKFTKIEKLTLSFFPSVDRVIQFLDEYGHGLHSLKIHFCIGHLQLSSILDRCPKLQSFFLKSSSMIPECSRPDIHSFLTGLIEFDFRYPISDDQEPILLDILSVPTLECATLYMSCEHFHLQLEDIEKLTAMIASRQILGNLRRLKIFVYNIERDINQRVFRALSDFIKSASAFLPHLTHLESNILLTVQDEMNSEAIISDVASLKKFINVYEN